MPVELTDSAVRQVKRMMGKHELGEGYGLRIAVKAGGCAGREYAMDLVEGPEEKDRVYEFGGVSVFIDPRSYLFLGGLKLDYEESLLGGQFKFENPNASNACGCGTSFST